MNMNNMNTWESVKNRVFSVPLPSLALLVHPYLSVLQDIRQLHAFAGSGGHDDHG